MLYEAGQEGSGLANAGSAALATDPSVLMNNPAGISELSGTQINVNGQVILGDITFSRDSNNDFSGNEGGNVLKWMPGSSLFVSHQINDRASIGFGMYGTFGLAVDYDDDWIGRYFTQEAAILGVSLQPTYAYKINDQLSIGFGPHLMYGYFRTEAGVNNNVLNETGHEDGQLEVKDTDTGLGFNIGTLYKPNERTSIGLAYTSKVDFTFEDSPKLDGISNQTLNTALDYAKINGITLDVSVPQTLVLSVAYDLDPQWKLLGSLGWQDWSEFGEIGVAVDTSQGGTDTTVDRQYKDTWHASIGAQYQATRQLRWNMGLGYDSSMVDDADRTADNPADASWRLAAGFNYALDENVDIHMAYTLDWIGDIDITQTKKSTGSQLSGEYTNSALHIIGGGMTWRF